MADELHVNLALDVRLVFALELAKDFRSLFAPGGKDGPYEAAKRSVGLFGLV
jgi:hypothetical protein